MEKKIRKEEVTDKITLYNCDCMEFMKNIPDKYFDLAICDPPYGIDRFKNNHPSRLNKYGSMESVNNLVPDELYFRELFRVSSNQIIWGYNHLANFLPTTKEFIFWYKHQPVDTYSDGELAWTSFTHTAKCFDYPYYGNINSDKVRIHPTQKPVKLYEWLLRNYAKPTDKILDTHFGSCSIGIACHNFGCSLDACELDEEYFNKALERLKVHVSQLSLF